MGYLKGLAKQAEEKSKAYLRSQFLSLLPSSPPVKAPVDVKAVSRILAVRPDARLGNILLLTPALRLIKEAFPLAQTDILMPKAYAAALKFNPCVSRVLNPKEWPFLRFLGYDLAFDFSSYHAFSLSGALWTAWSGARWRLGYQRGESDKFINMPIPCPREKFHETVNLANLVRQAAGRPLRPDSDLRLEWHWGQGEQEEGERFWRNQGLDQESVALFIGARDQKRLPLAWFLEIASLLRAQGRKTALLIGPAERRLIENVSLPVGTVLLPEMPLRKFAAALSNARAVLTADTGPMHLCVSLNIPTVELFSHSEPWRFGYSHWPSHRVIETAGRWAEVGEVWPVLLGLLNLSFRNNLSERA